MARKLAILLVVVCLSGGCVSRQNWAYQNSPYESYLNARIYHDDNNPDESMKKLVLASRKNPPETFWIHWQIAKWAYLNKHYGTCLFALNELNKYYPGRDVVIFNIGVLLDKYGQKEAARGRFEYVLSKSDNYMLKNRCTLIIMHYDNNEEIKDDYYALAFG